MRLIDADALAAEILDTYGSDAGSEDVTVIYGMVINAPTVDAVPVRHGRWKRISPARIYECSKCGQVVMTCDIDVYKYCHGCGAKMEADDATD